MSKSLLAKLYMLVLIMLFVIGTSFCFAAEKKSSKKKTIQEVTQKTPSELPKPPRISSSVNKHSIGLGLGQIFLKGDFDDHGDDAITWDLLYSYSASHSFDMFINFHHTGELDGTRKKGSWVKLTGLALGIKGKVYQFDAFAPFVVGGLGFYNPKVKRSVSNVLIESDSKITFGTHIGAGFELRLNPNFLVGCLGHYHNPFDIKQEQLLGGDIEGSYFKLLIMGLYTF